MDHACIILLNTFLHLERNIEREGGERGRGLSNNTVITIKLIIIIKYYTCACIVVYNSFICFST